MKEAAAIIDQAGRRARVAAASAPRLGDVMRARGATAGFDYLRIALALAVLAWHSIPITSGRESSDALLETPLGPFVRMILPMFFALSGFLVATSLFRTNNLKTFLLFRALRIAPALSAEVLLSALVLGPLFTTLALGDYFTSSEFRAYFLNAVGIIHFELPGVFAEHPETAVNGSLWTVPIELECYLALAALSLTTIVRRPSVMLAMTIAGGLLVAVFTFMESLPGGGVDGVMAALSGAQDAFNFQNAEGAAIKLRRILILCFLAGVTVFLYRDRLPHSPLLAASAFIASLLLLSSTYGYGFAPLLAAYATAVIGLADPPRHKLLLSGDYSYGVYLYAFPIQQMVYSIAPGQSAFSNFCISLVAVSAFAVFSWHVVEKHALSLRKRFV